MWTNDSRRFLLEHFDIISQFPSQIYCSALPSCPAPSWLKKYYSMELSQAVKVVKGVSAEWKACSRTIMVDDIPDVLLYKNNIIAVGLDTGKIIVLDALTGSQTAILSGHRDPTSLVFSSDGKLLVSGSEDGTIELWDVQTGGIVETFCSHTGPVYSVSILPDSTRIASGSDEAIFLWDVQTRECHYFLRLQDGVDYVGFSPMSSGYLISISDSKIQQWDINGHKVGPEYDGFQIIFSSDNTQFALCNENSVIIQKSVSGEIITELLLPEDDPPEYCCFSPDCRLVAVSTENTIYVWDISNPDSHLVGTIQLEEIKSIVFSSPSCLISGSYNESYDGFVKFWEVGALSTASISSAPESTLPPSTEIIFVSLQVSEGIAISGDSSGVVKIWSISDGLCKASFQTAATQRFYGDAQMIDGRLLFIWGSESKIHIWDSGRGKIPQMLEVSTLSGVRISEDGSKVFIMDDENHRIKAWSIWKWELVGEVELGERQRDNEVNLSPFHASGSKVWIQFEDSTTRGWDFEISGSSPIQLPDTPSKKLCLDGFFWKTNEFIVMDMATGKEVFRVSKEAGGVDSVRWDGQYLIVGCEDGEVLIFDFYHLIS